MKIARPLAVATAFVLLSACSETGHMASANGSSSPSVQPSVTTSEPSTAPAGASPAQSNPPTAQPTRTGDVAAPNSPATPGADPDEPRDLAGGMVALTGTVTTAGNCPVLYAGSQRWALLGSAAKQVRDGSRVTVRGRPAAVPAGCGAGRALQVAFVS